MLNFLLAASLLASPWACAQQEPSQVLLDARRRLATTVTGMIDGVGVGEVLIQDLEANEVDIQVRAGQVLFINVENRQGRKLV